ncbi:MAG: Phosphoglycerate kinase [candidate division CPR2 bacterium GW2011_GWC1_39_9]|uniref:Phosphoglycerate kinase n=1 Tax=candidate division CPR2 bacterium GW2011_GWC2_39_10 TaxID=1618345 RepID=A0A0G0M047_UNCC2|nr:MAG: Phosphoglycerate kinase [candidate division CPR2 bacterium GW2011_GWC2_39_10]KKR34196.1 MAG: Phosphoglycerate kinase [candidate division CPR2 bacterium GW2011_GWC1_39_9]
MKVISDIKDYDLKNAKVLVRVDYDVKMENGKVISDNRMKASLDTIKYLREKGAKLILMSHLGRPDGKAVKEMSLLPVAEHLAEILGVNVSFAPDIMSEQTKKMIDVLDNGDILLLENLRYYAGEEGNDEEFAKRLSSFANIYVNDAFATSHRAHASMDAVPRILDNSYAGFQLQREVENLSKITDNPKRPLVAIIGGKKVSDKVKVLENFLKFVDIILVGGGAANVFLASQDYEIGDSFVEDDLLDFADDLLSKAESMGVQIIIPSDVVVAKKVDNGQKTETKDVVEVDKDDIIVDIGPETVESFKEPIEFAGTIVWNGPLGIFEFENFKKGNDSVAELIADSGAFTLIGGGDTIAGLPKGLKEKYSYMSTAGGATLDFLAGKKLPGIEAVK